MGVIQCSDGAGFTLEALTKPLRRDLDGDAAVKAGVGGAEEASHAPQRGLDPVRAEHGGRRAAVVRFDGRGRFIQRAGLVARRHHLPDHFAQSGIGCGQEGRAVGWALFDFREEALDLLPSLRLSKVSGQP